MRFPPLSAYHADQPSPPVTAKNLLIVMSDEHRRDAMGCMGHRIVQTPKLDRLARSGTVFESAETPSPMCAPARATAACGELVHNIR